MLPIIFFEITHFGLILGWAEVQRPVREKRYYQGVWGPLCAFKYTMSYLGNTPRPGDPTGSP